MQGNLDINAKGEIDLRELFITLWVYKLLIVVCCAIGIFLSSYHAVSLDKKFTSTAIFKLNLQSANSAPLSKEFSALAGIAGLNTQSSKSGLPFDKVNGRIFIKKIDTKLNFKSDPYFNSYNPNPVEPIWKSFIKNAIGWKKNTTNIDEAIWHSIISKYTKNIKFYETANNNVKIIVTHKDPNRAAEIANVIMDEIITSAQLEEEDERNQQLTYLSNKLAQALNDLEISQSNLNEFALKNSALPLESFAAESLGLDAFREQLNRTSELYDAVAALLLILQNETLDQKNYISLRQRFPIIDRVEFRRILGQNEIISSWNWPEISTVAAVFDTLTERRSRLQSQIDASQIDAERSGLTLDVYAKLLREQKQSEATYAVLIESVKAQNMFLGYKSNKAQIYEYASPSINPSEPKNMVILVLGACLGLFLGVGFSLTLAFVHGACNSKSSLINKSQARLTASIRSLLPMRNKNLLNINSTLMKKPISVLRDMAVEIHKSDRTQVVISSLRAKITSDEVAKALATYMQSDNMKIAILDFSSKRKKLDVNTSQLSHGQFLIAENFDNISVLKPSGDSPIMELLSKKDFCEIIESLNSTFNIVFLCADNSDVFSLLRALEGQKLFHITLAKTKRTKSATLSHVRSLLSIQGLLYD